MQNNTFWLKLGRAIHLDFDLQITGEASVGRQRNQHTIKLRQTSPSHASFSLCQGWVSQISHAHTINIVSSPHTKYPSIPQDHGTKTGKAWLLTLASEGIYLAIAHI